MFVFINAWDRLYQVKELLDDQWEAVFQEDYKAVIYAASTGQRMAEYLYFYSDVNDLTFLFTPLRAYLKSETSPLSSIPRCLKSKLFRDFNPRCSLRLLLWWPMLLPSLLLPLPTKNRFLS